MIALAMIKVQPIANSYWVLPKRLLAGPYPGAADKELTRARLLWLREQGISLCLDLTEAGEGGLLPYADIWREIGEETDAELNYQRLSIPDFSVPEPEQMQYILDTLDLALVNGQTIYLHCWGGIGRTGTAVGCYLVRCGLDGEAAIRQIALWRRHTPLGWRPSPETEQQRQFILNWRVGQ